jgi:hypothetical protein
LHEIHYLNYQNYGSISTALVELQRNEEAVPFIQKQIKCLERFKEGTPLQEVENVQKVDLSDRLEDIVCWHSRIRIGHVTSLI